MASELHPASDAATICAWLEDYLGQHCDHWAQAIAHVWSALPRDEHIKRLVARDWRELCHAAANEDEHVFVSRGADDAPCGILHVELSQDRYMLTRYGVISWIYVSPDHRMSGVADGLMARAMDWFKARDVSGLEVFVSDFNVAAQALYARYGFVIQDQRMLAKRP